MKLKLLLKKIMMTSLIVCISWNIVIPHVILASSSSDEEKGGPLMGPIQSFVVGLGDSFMELMQYAFMGDKEVVYKRYAGESEYLLLSFWENVAVDWIYIPNFKISPGAIFSNQIPALDVNFFSPNPDEEYTIEGNVYKTITTNLEAFINLIHIANDSTDSEEAKDATQAYKDLAEEIYNNLVNVQDIIDSSDGNIDIDDTTKEALSNCIEDVTGEGPYHLHVQISDTSDLETVYNWINSNPNALQDQVIEIRHSSAGQLRQIVSYWYNALRIIATLGLLCVLVYAGIKILLSSTAADQAKYKTILKDWLIAMCLLYFMHYFMNFTVTIVNSVTEALTQLTEFSENGDETENTEEETGITYTGDKLMGDVRIKAQQGDVSNRMTFTIVYIVLVIYTFVFAIIYIKRVIYMAFLTIIAPLVAMTYPLDKMKDGKAQAFGMWMKEYIYNMLLQPFHLILYYILVTTAMDLATENPIYAIIAVGFLIPAEKLLRNFFGFNNKETMGAMNAAMGGALVNQAIGALRRGGVKNSSDGNTSGAEKLGEEDFFEEPVRTMDTSFLVSSLGSTDANIQTNSMNIGSSSQVNVETPDINGMPVNVGDMPDFNLQNQQYEEWKKELKEMENQGLGVGDESYDALKQQIELYEKAFQSKQGGISQDFSGQAGNTISMQLQGKQTTNPPEYNNQNNEEKPHYIRGVLATAGSFVGPSVKTLAKLAAGGVLGGAGLITGVAGGISTGDYDKALSFGIGGATAGYLAGTNLAKKGMDLPSNIYRKVDKASIETKKEFMEKAYSPEQYKRKMADLADARFLNDKRKQEKYRRRYGRQYRRAMEDAVKYRKQGITDDELIMDAMDLKIRGFNEFDRADNKKIAAAKLAMGVSKEKDLTSVEKRLKELGIDPEQVDLQKAAIRELKGLY